MLLSDVSSSHGLFRRLHLDPPLLMGLVILAAVGLVVLYSAANQSEAMLWRQITRLGVSFGVMLILAQISPDTLMRWTHWIFAAGLIMLISVLVFGDTGKGAQRWLSLGSIRFQPSELMKLAVPMMVAWYLAEKPLPPRFGHLVIAILIAVVPTLLIAKQPDLGTALLIATSGFFVLVFAGMQWRIIAMASVLAVPAAWVLWNFGMREYQQQRVLTFLNPESDPLGSGYHIIQSKIAIGSGGTYGKGWLNGTQSHLEFLPERHTDFIFAVFSEEFGFIGVLLLISLYLFIILRGLYIAAQAQDSFCRLLAGALTMTFLIYLFVNIGMVSGLLPVVGVPLPLISYGGSSMVTLMASFGILMSIHTHRKLLKE
ncbi:MAG: rod shape-determining protein RodA [Chromatiales bacterium]|nr:rod shape-determining protein RodA [Chromatiales bacterium]